ncbi:Crp/Fnr family transcriptional regulator [Algoriphagus sp. D3-2-R+10]|uniref:Crp/Fnr family transcriptional regulator n=1 Tax=Algoriphagus aurantiacus TaxID=3103948 RepID=UPI002B3BB7C9|nr:Crp/Fnr family transcriptional regulator [Algoriphagus sp. D3-2-R+10]MEB2774328.1 Crp/Fnr family transcriptional regulator [Algoriphagus sp. D3-2-R+10]
MTNLVRHIQNYVSLTDSEIKRINEDILVISLKKKEFLLQEGSTCQSNYFVSQGCLRMYFIKENAKEQITQFAIENWWISDYMSLSTQKSSSFYIQAIEDSEIMEFDTSSFELLLEDVPKLERYFRLVTQRAYAAAQFRIKFLYDLSREELYHHFSSHFPEFVQRVPQYMLASYLGFTPEYLSELRKKR